MSSLLNGHGQVMLTREQILPEIRRAEGLICVIDGIKFLGSLCQL